MIPARNVFLTAMTLGFAGCGWGDKFELVSMGRKADGAAATCSATYAVSVGIGAPPPNVIGGPVARCVAACKKLGFVVESTLPRDINTETKDMGDVPDAECAILRKL